MWHFAFLIFVASWKWKPFWILNPFKNESFDRKRNLLQGVSALVLENYAHLGLLKKTVRPFCKCWKKCLSLKTTKMTILEGVPHLLVAFRTKTRKRMSGVGHFAFSMTKCVSLCPCVYLLMLEWIVTLRCLNFWVWALCARLRTN